jgi:hypothetical protein
MSIDENPSPSGDPGTPSSAYRAAIVRAILIAVDRLVSSLGYPPTRRRLVHFLRGTQLPPLPDGVAEPPEPFAILETHPTAWVRAAVDGLAAGGYLAIEPRRPGPGESVSLTPLGRVALLEGATFPASILPSKPRLGAHPEVEGRLREARRELAREAGWNAYQVFPNTVLAAIADRRPTTAAELSQIDGLGEMRLRRFGQRILDAVGGRP